MSVKRVPFSFIPPELLAEIEYRHGKRRSVVRKSRLWKHRVYSGAYTPEGKYITCLVRQREYRLFGGAK